MAFPTSAPLFDGLQRARNTAGSVKRAVTSLRDASASADTRRGRYLDLVQLLSGSVTTFNEVAAIPGIAAYAKDQYDDPGLDIVAEFTAMVSACSDLKDWIVANVPKSGSTWLLETYDSDGNVTKLMFTPAQTVNFRVECNNLLATIG